MVTDASSTGFARFAYYIGVPWVQPQAGSINVGLWTAAQSVCSSNWRESNTLLLCVRNPMMQQRLEGRFVVWISDNQCGVAMATHLFLPTRSIEPLAREFRSRLADLNVQSVGVHLPGVLNYFADAPSRAAETLYESMCLAPPCRAWVESLNRPKHIQSVVGVGEGDLRSTIGNITLFVPPPHRRQALLNDAITLAARQPLTTVLVILPHASYAEERWAHFMLRIRHVATMPLSVQLYAKRACASNESWVNSVSVPTRPEGQWALWRVLHLL